MTLACRFYAQKYPEVEDVVMGKVFSITETEAHVHLTEYNSIEGIVPLSELSYGSMRSANKASWIGRDECLVVVRVDVDKDDKWKMNRHDCGSALALSHDGKVCQCRVRKEWHGIRSTKGVLGSGKYFYETKVTHNGRLRLGWSTLAADLVLGTDKEGFGISGTGKKANAKQFDKYGESFCQNDIIGCYVDLDNGTIKFSKNGSDMGEAFVFASNMMKSAFFPAAVLMNAELEVNLGDTPFKYPPNGGYIAVCEAPKENTVASTFTGVIDLSKRRVSSKDKKKCQEKFEKAKAVNNILRQVADILKFETDDQLEELYNKTAWYFDEKFKKQGSSHDCFKHAVNDTSILDECGLDETTKNALIRKIKKRFASRTRKAKTDSVAPSHKSVGTDPVTDAPRAGIASSAKHMPIKADEASKNKSKPKKSLVEKEGVQHSRKHKDGTPPLHDDSNKVQSDVIKPSEAIVPKEAPCSDVSPDHTVQEDKDEPHALASLEPEQQFVTPYEELTVCIRGVNSTTSRDDLAKYMSWAGARLVDVMFIEKSETNHKRIAVVTLADEDSTERALHSKLQHIDDAFVTVVPLIEHVTEESERISLPVETKTTPKRLVLRSRVRNPDSCSPFTMLPTSCMDSDISGYHGKYSKKKSDSDLNSENSEQKSLNENSDSESHPASASISLSGSRSGDTPVPGGSSSVSLDLPPLCRTPSQTPATPVGSPVSFRTPSEASRTPAASSEKDSSDSESHPASASTSWSGSRSGDTPVLGGSSSVSLDLPPLCRTPSQTPATPIGSPVSLRTPSETSKTPAASSEKDSSGSESYRALISTSSSGSRSRDTPVPSESESLESTPKEYLTSTIVVRNLHKNARHQNIVSYFVKFGPVKNCEIVCAQTGIVHANIEFYDPAAAGAAVSERYHNISGTRVRVTLAEIQPDEGVKTDSQRSTIVVKGLRKDASYQNIISHFQQFGPIKSCSMIYSQDAGHFSRQTRIEFCDPSAAERAASKRYRIICDTRVRVELAAYGEPENGKTC